MILELRYSVYIGYIILAPVSMSMYVLFGNIGITYGFPFIIIHHVPKVFKTESVANVNEW